ncbi:ribosomal protection-like ABC-F family protein [Bacillus sp. SM2101]|uniref:ribosomal protection-like ABC-F family protein n=1 Tax=Bacillus sp. SM2101 TaxID=2805366 RepID=UPI001BDE992F|nr:ABC-F type ribosomal protection protein [Bacillus sp. SM2101]
MLLLDANQIEKSYGDRTILNIQQLQVFNGEKIGVVGKNGEGKSTLLKILVEQLEPDSGIVNVYCPIAYIPQLEDLEVSDIPQKLNGHWRIPKERKQFLSGGEETRKKIASALSANAKLIIADEPTSHLDVEGIEQFERELKAFAGSVIIISHDQQLLNQVCTTIWELDKGKVHCYDGNYEAYVEQKKHLKDRQQFEYEQYVKEKQRLEQAAVEKSQKSKSLKKAPSRMGNSEARLHKRSVGQKKAKLDKGVHALRSRIDQLEKKEKPKQEEDITFDISQFKKIHSKRAIAFNEVSVKMGNRLLFSDLNGAIKPGARVAIIGRNGVGKTTLLNMIATRHEDISIAKPASIGYFHQKLESLDEHKTILENVKESSHYSEQFIRTVLSRLRFKRENVHNKVSMLSGGERVKTELVKVFLGDYNVLLLDEPTNYLDLQTKEALQMVLTSYPGTILFVTHDRYFVQELATHILQIEHDKGVLKDIDLLESNDSVEQQQEETNLLAVEMELTEVLSRLSLITNEDEKQMLEARFSNLLAQKKQLVNKKSRK